MSQINNDFNWSNILPWNWDIWKTSNSNPYTVQGMTPESIAEFNKIQQINPVYMKTNVGGTDYNKYFLGKDLGENRFGWVDLTDPRVMLDVNGNKIGVQDLEGNWSFNKDQINPNNQNSFANNLAAYGGLALNGIQSLGNLYMGNKMYGLAKDQFKFQKDFANRNLANSIKSYNNALTDRINSRFAFEGRSQAEADDYLKKHSL